MNNVRYGDFGRNEVELFVSEIAVELGYCERTIEQFTAEGMPSRVRGRRRTYRATECRNWLARRPKGGLTGAKEAAGA